MAKAQHLTIFEQGVDAWNQWRKQNPHTTPDLSHEDIGGILVPAELHETFTGDPDAVGRFIRDGRNLRGIDLHGTALYGAILDDANLSDANLYGAYLDQATLFKTNLNGADMRKSWLWKTSFNFAELTDVNLGHASIGYTIFGNVDLSRVKGLETATHLGPSTIDIGTFYRSRGNIPEAFLRGAGLPDTFIVYVRSLVGLPIQYYSCFISYSSKDQAFAERLHNDLQSKGVRCWFAPEDMKIGDRIRIRIDESIRLYDKLLLVLSENSIQSAWVEKEVETAFEKESRQKKLALFPIRLDDAVMHTDQTWAADIRRTRHIGNFRCWKDHSAYQKAFDRLLCDLKVEEANEES